MTRQLALSEQSVLQSSFPLAPVLHLGIQLSRNNYNFVVGNSTETSLCSFDPLMIKKNMLKGLEIIKMKLIQTFLSIVSMIVGSA